MKQPEKFVLTGLSGGPDSVALLHWLCSSSDKKMLLATHCNFHLRGDESMRDQHFCEELCRRLGVELVVKHFDTFQFMADEHLSLEMAARRLRYEWWESLADEKQRATGREVVIAVGHHRDDSIETLLMNLMRGTGINGLTGIPRQNGRIVRPLSDWTRAKILSYLADNHLDYITDSSNLADDTVRNAIRNRLVPLMEQINPNARDGIAATMRHLRQTRTLAEARLDEIFAATRHFREAGVEWDELRLPDTSDEAMTKTLFHHWSERYADARRTGRLFFTAISDISRETITIDAEAAQKSRVADFQITTIDGREPFSADYELFDADALQFPLTLRHWQDGDRIQPLGMTQTKLVSDLFTNAHLSPNRKAATWIFADASGRIFWAVGLRVAEWSKVTDETRRTLKVQRPL